MPVKENFFIESLASLYTDVQSRQVFPDSKFFVDCIPLSPAAVIAADYDAAKHQPGFDLATFVAKHFKFPVNTTTNYTSSGKPIRQNLEDLWDVLQRQPDSEGGTLIPLPFPYIVPGGRFREIYYWDSYFTMLGLQVSGRIDMIENMVRNFAYLIDTFGFVPNANRTYYLGRSQPPFFVLMVELLAEERGPNILLQYQPQLEREYHSWMEGAQQLGTAHASHGHVVRTRDGYVLNRYWDDHDIPRPEAYIEDVELANASTNAHAIVYRHLRAAAESGWDFCSRWFTDAARMETICTTNLLPVDLNCLLLHLEETLLGIYTTKNETALMTSFGERVGKRKQAIQTCCWNNVKGFYFDYNHYTQQQSAHYTLAAVFPLFFSVATAVQAQQVAQKIAEKFLHTGGLVTTLVITGQQWDAPNGWAPLQWMAYKGLMNYGHTELAKQIKDRWMATNEKVYAHTGKMMEKYNVTDAATNAGGGEYPNQDGFGWTNGVYLKLKAEPD
jgi:alpha,alpha-trehalase